MRCFFTYALELAIEESQSTGHSISTQEEGPTISILAYTTV